MYHRPRDVRGFVEELKGEAKGLRARARTLRVSAAQPARKYAAREDIREAKRRIAQVLEDAAALIENRIFADFS